MAQSPKQLQVYVGDPAKVYVKATVVPGATAYDVAVRELPGGGHRTVWSGKPANYRGTTEWRSPDAIRLEPGKSYEVRARAVGGVWSDATIVTVPLPPAPAKPTTKANNAMPGPVLIVHTRPTTPLPPGEPAVPPPTPSDPTPAPAPVTPIPSPPPPSTPEPDPPVPSDPRILIDGPITTATRLERGKAYRLSRSQTTPASLQLLDDVTIDVDEGVVVRYSDVEAFRYVRYVAPPDAAGAPADSYANVAAIEAYAWLDGLWPEGQTDPVAQLPGTPIGNVGPTLARAFDGNPATFVAAATPGTATAPNWIGLDLGSPKLVGQLRITPRAGFPGRIKGGRLEGSNTPDFASPTVLARIQDDPTEGVNRFDARGKPYQGPIDFAGNRARVTGGEWRFGNGQRTANFRAACEDCTLDVAIGGHYPGEGVTLFGTLRTTITLRATKIWGNLVYVAHNSPKARDVTIKDCRLTIGSIQENGIRVMDADGCDVNDNDINCSLFKRNPYRFHGTRNIRARRNKGAFNWQLGPMGGGDGGQAIGRDTWYDAAGRLVSKSLADLAVTAARRVAELAHRLTNVLFEDCELDACQLAVDAGIVGDAIFRRCRFAADPAQTGATNVVASPISRGRIGTQYPQAAYVQAGDVLRLLSPLRFEDCPFTGNASLATFLSQIPTAWTFVGCTYNGVAFTSGTWAVAA